MAKEEDRTGTVGPETGRSAKTCSEEHQAAVKAKEEAIKERLAQEDDDRCRRAKEKNRHKIRLLARPRLHTAIPAVTIDDAVTDQLASCIPGRDRGEVVVFLHGVARRAAFEAALEKQRQDAESRKRLKRVGEAAKSLKNAIISLDNSGMFILDHITELHGAPNLRQLLSDICLDIDDVAKEEEKTFNRKRGRRGFGNHVRNAFIELIDFYPIKPWRDRANDEIRSIESVNWASRCLLNFGIIDAGQAPTCETIVRWWEDREPKAPHPKAEPLPRIATQPEA